MLCGSLFCWDYIITRMCVCQGLFWKLLKMFLCVDMSYWHYLYYHMIMWLSIIISKNYDKIIIQTYVRICSAQIVQIWFYRTFVLSEKNGQYISINHRFYMMGVLKTKMIVTFWQHLHSWLFHTLTQKCNLISNLKIPKKIKQNPKFHPSNHLSYPISSIHLFYKPFIHFNP